MIEIYTFEQLLREYQNEDNIKYPKILPIRYIKEDSLLKWIKGFEVDGASCIATTDLLKGQKNGELLAINKLKKELEV